MNFINLLSAAAPVTPAAAGGDAASGNAGEAGSFAQMLGDASANADRSAPPPLPKTAATAATPVLLTADNSLLASLQDVDQEKLTNVLTQPIGADEARDLLAKLQDMQDGATGQDEAFDQLREALEDIAQGGEPTDVAGVLDSLPAIAEAPTPAERTPVLHRMLSWMQSAMEKQKEAPQHAAVQPDSTTQSLQASLFPAGHDAVAAPQAQAAESSDEQEPQDASAQAPAPLAALPAALVVAAIPQSTVPEWVRRLEAGAENIASPEVDTAIPALTTPPATPLKHADSMKASAQLPVDDSLPQDSGLPQESKELPDNYSTHSTPPKTQQALVQESDLPAVNLPPAPDMADKGAAAKTAPVAFRDQLQELAQGDQPASDPLPVTPTNGSHIQAVATAQGTTSTHAASPLNHPALNHATPHTTASEQVQVAITTATKDGLDKITVQLDPADLGRVEVKMELGADGRTHLSFTVDKPETLDALSRDARSLERSLQEAGLKSDAGSMQFNLRQPPQQTYSGDSGQGRNKGQQAANDNDEAIAPLAAIDGITKNYTINVREGVDIRA